MRILHPKNLLRFVQNEFVTAIVIFLLTEAFAWAGARPPNTPDLPAVRAHTVTAAGRGASNALTLAVPRGAHPGDTLIAELAELTETQGSVVAITPPTGWTLIRRDDTSSLSQAIFFHFIPIAPAEPRDYVWNFSTNTQSAGGIVLAANVNGGGPSDASNGQGGSNLTAVTAPSVAIPPGHQDNIVLGFYAIAGGSKVTAPAGTRTIWNTAGPVASITIVSSLIATAASGSTPAESAIPIGATAGIGVQLSLTQHAPIFPGVNNRTAANAPGAIVSGNTVTVYLPFGSDSSGTVNASRAVTESGSPLPPPQILNTGNVNSCAPAQSGEVVCSQALGSIDLIQPGSTSATVIKSGVTIGNSYTGGFCVACGATIDDSLNLGIISTGAGFVILNLANNSVSAPISNNNEPVSVNFGYDPVRHRILNANYKVTDPHTFATSSPHYQIIDLSSASPQIYELATDHAFLVNPHRICSSRAGRAFRDTLPDDNAIDTSTNIALVTFHVPSNCFSKPIQDIALIDLAQATFTPGSPAGTWDTPGKIIQTLDGLDQSGITGISVVSGAHLAIVADQFNSNKFSALQLPAASGPGAGIPTMVDWVQGALPSDPNGKPWQMSSQPNGVTSYLARNGRATGVIMNSATDSSGNQIGPTFVALIDLQSLLDAKRSPQNGHMLDPSVDLLGSGILTFVKTQ